MCKRRPPKISTFVVVFYPFWRRSHYQTSGSNRQGAVTLCERPGRTWLDANTEALKTCTTSVWHRIKTMRQIMPAAPTHAGGGLRAEEATLTTGDGRSGDWCADRLARPPTASRRNRSCWFAFPCSNFQVPMFRLLANAPLPDHPPFTNPGRVIVAPPANVIACNHKR